MFFQIKPYLPWPCAYCIRKNSIVGTFIIMIFLALTGAAGLQFYLQLTVQYFSGHLSSYWNEFEKPLKKHFKNCTGHRSINPLDLSGLFKSLEIKKNRITSL